ncbi:MAG: DUF1211 domain-containing protein [Sphingomonas sp.]|uniref:TMEM175 family protein n=1 Tax=Sphingomonas sp. TaxID=28214 RepID=UPI001ACC51F4|nr:TMEM175 family protein [Sphingomonas sp.]MBN8808810.1 DUF1211 domain-containing protein [Sphingomonas sp.]
MNDAHDDLPMHHGAPAHALERLVFFSDAVFAISITLLVIEIHAPSLKRGLPDAAYVNALLQLTPNFIGFIISFFVIAQFWAGHHRAFDCARRWSPRLVFPNICLLFTVAAMPFFTAFLSENAGNRVPTIVYCGWLALTGLCNLWVNSIATAPPVADAQVAAERGAMIRARGQAVVLMALSGAVVGWFVPWGAQPALASFGAWLLLTKRLNRAAA